jgi:UDP-N-acetylmuramate dehydrogenase
MKLDYLKTLKDIEVFEDVDLTNYSTIKLKSKGSIVIIKSIEAVEKVIPLIKNHNHQIQVIGLGANTFLRESMEKVLIKLDFQFDIKDLEVDADEYVLPANVLLSQMTRSAIKNGHVGWEGLTGIPATLGGAITMNAGTALGETKDIIKSVKILRYKGTIEDLAVGKDDFSYRKNKFLSDGDIILSAVVNAARKDDSIPKKIKDYYEYRKKTQPLSAKTCGCLFKNMTIQNKKSSMLCRAGQFLDVAGLRGFRFGNLRMSPVHANFLENIGGATYSDIINFVKILQNEIEFEYGMEFDLEVRF